MGASHVPGLSHFVTQISLRSEDTFYKHEKGIKYL